MHGVSFLAALPKTWRLVETRERAWICIQVQARWSSEALTNSDRGFESGTRCWAFAMYLFLQEGVRYGNSHNEEPRVAWRDQSSSGCQNFFDYEREAFLVLLLLCPPFYHVWGTTQAPRCAFQTRSASNGTKSLYRSARPSTPTQISGYLEALAYCSPWSKSACNLLGGY